LSPPPEVLRALYKSPVAFAESALKAELWSGQRDILDSVGKHEKTVVKSCHASGKTFAAACVVLWFLFTRKPAVVFTTAPTWSQVRLLLWKEIASAFHRLPAELRALGECQQTTLNIWSGGANRTGQTDHFAVGRSTDDAENLQGLHSPHLLVVIDEAAGVPQDIYDVIDTFGAGGEYRELLIGNPTSTEGRFYQAFQNEALGYNRLSIAAEDTPAWTGEQVPEFVARQLLQPDRAEEWRVKHGEESPYYQARVKAQFPSATSDTVLVPLAWLEAARDPEAERPAGEPVQVGADVARFGGSRTSCAARQGGVLFKARSDACPMNTQEAAAYIRDFAEEVAAETGAEEVTVLVDEGGNPGVIDTLQGLQSEGIRYQAVNFGSAALDKERHVNRRCEMLWGVREAAQRGNTVTDLVISATGEAIERFVSQASAIRFKYEASRLRPLVETKQDMTKRNMPSPDELDSVALCFAGTPAAADPWADYLRDQLTPTATEAA